MAKRNAELQNTENFSFPFPSFLPCPFLQIFYPFPLRYSLIIPSDQFYLHIPTKYYVRKRNLPFEINSPLMLKSKLTDFMGSFMTSLSGLATSTTPESSLLCVWYVISNNVVAFQSFFKVNMYPQSRDSEIVKLKTSLKYSLGI